MSFASFCRVYGPAVLVTCVLSAIGFVLLSNDLQAEDGDKTKPAETAAEKAEPAQRKGGEKAERKAPFAGRSSARPEMGGKIGAFMQLKPQEQKKLRTVMGKVWADPELASARSVLNDAMENYQKTLMAKVKEQDPEAAELMNKYKAQRPPMGGGPRMPGPQGNPQGGKKADGSRPSARAPRLGEHLPKLPSQMLALVPAAAFAKATPEEKQKLAAAMKEARDAPEVLEKVEALKEHEAKHKEIRKSRLGLLRDLRQTFHAKLIEVDPSLESLIQKQRPEKKAKSKE